MYGNGSQLRQKANKGDQNCDLNTLAGMQKLCSLVGILVLLVLLQNLILSTKPFKNNSMLLLLLLLLFSSLSIFMMIVTVVVAIILCSLTVPIRHFCRPTGCLYNLLFPVFLCLLRFLISCRKPTYVHLPMRLHTY